jgi:hypothetical protein
VAPIAKVNDAKQAAVAAGVANCHPDPEVGIFLSMVGRFPARKSKCVKAQAGCRTGDDLSLRPIQSYDEVLSPSELRHISDRLCHEKGHGAAETRTK